MQLPDCYQPSDTQAGDCRADRRRVPNAACPKRALSSAASTTATRSRPPFSMSGCGCCDAVPGSVLWLVDVKSAWQRQSCGARRPPRRRAERLVFAPRRADAGHLARLGLADLFLDTLPYNAGATASDALWAGLPVLTCAGKTYVGRMAGALLTAARAAAS